MKTETAIKHFGNKTIMSKELGITSQAISQWGEDVPLGRAYQIESLTKGKLKVKQQKLSKAS